MRVVNTIGRRKTSVARIYVSEGQGQIVINDRPMAAYFPTEELRQVVVRPLDMTNSMGTYDIKVNVKGGGVTGQAEAIRLAITRALCEIAPENRTTLKPEGLLTRDPRMVERKKYGRAKARRRFQFSKR